MWRNLFNIAEEYLVIMDEIEQLEGELTEELQERLYINKNEYEAKMKAYHFVIKQSEADIQLLKDEQNNLSKKIKSKENLIARLKNTMLEALKIYGDNGKSGNKTSKFDTVTIYSVKHKPLAFENEELFNNKDYLRYSLGEKLSYEEAETVSKLLVALRNPEEKVSDDVANSYLAVYFRPEIMRTEIKKALEDGKSIEGVKIDEEASYLMRR